MPTHIRSARSSGGDVAARCHYPFAVKLFRKSYSHVIHTFSTFPSQTHVMVPVHGHLLRAECELRGGSLRTWMAGVGWPLLTDRFGVR